MNIIDFNDIAQVFINNVISILLSTTQKSYYTRAICLEVNTFFVSCFYDCH